MYKDNTHLRISLVGIPTCKLRSMEVSYNNKPFFFQNMNGIRFQMFINFSFIFDPNVSNAWTGSQLIK